MHYFRITKYVTIQKSCNVIAWEVGLGLECSYEEALRGFIITVFAAMGGDTLFNLVCTFPVVSASHSDFFTWL